MIQRLVFTIWAFPAILFCNTMADYNRAWMLWNEGRDAEAVEAAKAIIAADFNLL